MQRKNLNINEYSLKVKGLADSLASIGAPVDDEDLVSVTLNGLRREYAQFRTSIGVLRPSLIFRNLLLSC